MAKSKKRGGETAHRKKVIARNEHMKGLWKRLQKNAWDKFEEHKKEQSGKTQSEEIRFNVK